jgi:hypothetical protein
MMQLPYVVETSRGAVMFHAVGAPIVAITHAQLAEAQLVLDEREWQALEAECIVCEYSGYLIPKPDRVDRSGIMHWTGTGCGKGKTHPNAYKAPKPLGVPARAKSSAQAELLLTGTSTRYTAPQLGPVERRKGTFGSVVLKYNVRKATWTIGGR